ncbi:hypothetical protein K1719_035154 [Acacia pycnantha]|nr:hypothetical protein K1719_035154 [Acacia pycnantha]
MKDNDVSKGFKEASYEELWKLCAGPLTDIPQVGEKVFYFPQGHLEHGNPKVPDLNPPETPKQESQSFYKRLTTSDISKHEGVLVLQKHATKCLPQLDMTQKNPSQELVARDLHGFEWKFKHVYRDQAKTHLLTTGWSNFVSSKRLNAGDTILFLRGPNDNDLWCGVKHLTRQQNPVQSSVISSQCMHLGVLSTASHAIMTGSMFTVYYKPRISQFIVRLNKYLEAVNKNFYVGMPFMMRFEGHDSLEILRFSGTIVGVRDFSPIWPVSQWKSLKLNYFSTIKHISSRMRVDGLWPNSPLLRVSSSFAYEPRNNEASPSTQASASGYAPVSRRLNNGEHDQVENEEESGSSKNI